MSSDTCISVYGRLIDIGVPVFRWDHRNGFDGYATNKERIEVVDRRTGEEKTKLIRGRRYRKRALKSITQFMVHHSGGDGRTPSGMYETLHNRRGLSVHFAVEDNGHIWQFLDVREAALHGGKHNRISVGAELCLYPTRRKRPDYYSPANCKRRGNLPHEIRREKLQGMSLDVFVMPEPQIQSVTRLIAATWAGLAIESMRGGRHPHAQTKAQRMALQERFLQAPKFPRKRNGEIPMAVIREPLKHKGLIGHLHATRRKWDPAGFDWHGVEDGVEPLIEEFFEASR